MSRAIVDVVIPVRDGERYLAEAIESALAQTHPALDIVVVDDGSRDGSLAMAERYAPEVRCISQAPLGPGAARNSGAAVGRGEYIAFLDADDVWPRDRIEGQLAALEAEPSTDLIFGHMRQFVSPDLAPDEASALRCPDQPQPAFHMGTMLVPRTVWERVGGCATDGAVNDGLDWLLRSRDLGFREAMLGEVVVHRRLHATNRSRRHRQDYGEFAHALKASLDRRRG
jgi:glycosyltransferase involved in cell wall biosynthesis